MTADSIEENRRGTAGAFDGLRYRESTPGAVLDIYVQCFAEFTVEETHAPFVHRIIPDGCAHISYLRGPDDALGRLSVSGPRITPLVFGMTGGQVCWDVKVRPGAFESLTGLVVEAIVERVEAAADVCPRLHRALQSGLAASSSAEDAWRVFAETFMNWIDSGLSPDAVVQAAVLRIEESEGRMPISEVAASVSMSERQLQRRFQHAVGLSPKQFARIRRLRSCVGNMISEAPEAWGMVAVRQGYADQAHLTREFTELSGLPPTMLEPYVRAIEHADVVP